MTLRTRLFPALRRALPTLPWDELLVQAVLQYRIHLPHDEAAPGPAHTDYGVGHLLVERNLWAPLTPLTDESALQVMPLRPSLLIDAERCQRGARTLDDVDLALTPAKIDVGQALLFTPLHVHGARTNRGPHTRVSVDLRFLPADFARGYRWVPLA
jgi:ectoine hydroxylase-related dioxygenase (phytanoyl-CoA dioxygenase family)